MLAVRYLEGSFYTLFENIASGFIPHARLALDELN
jgi:hypothetical protein